ncbi:MAG: class I SAM-dependent methyltransferase [Spirochaetales bacterium]|nr:class I SAM-dependent methyltransferase [Spirochaetales bacterium]
MTDNNRKTIRYYDEHAEEFSTAANTADMSRDYERFLKYVPAGGTIVDIGCGNGRDLRFFSESGYRASGVDASETLCRLAAENSGCPVVHCDALSWVPETECDAIWANASLLHMPLEDIVSFIRTKTRHLKPGGVLYFSMKAGIGEGFDEKGRFFTPFSESIVDSVLAEGRLKVMERWTEDDSLGRGGFHWEALILGRAD